MHHVVPQGNGRCSIVLNDGDRFSYLRRLEGIAADLGWTVHASCLMDTHHHAVVETPEPNLGVGMRRLLGGHARWFNLRHDREGTLFAPHYWSRSIRDDAALYQSCLYVVLNPVAAGLCGHPAEWPWSSYSRTANVPDDIFVAGEERLLRMFGDSPAEARATYRAVVDACVERIQNSRAGDASGLRQAIEQMSD